MQFKFYECQVLQHSSTSICHIAVADIEHASALIEHHFEALGLNEARCKLQRVDDTLPEHWDFGADLDEILENAPAGLVSLTSIGWVAHTAPVHKLRLFASEDERGIPIYAAAPNKGVALALMVKTQLAQPGKVYTFDIRGVTDTLPESERKNLDVVLAAGQAGIAECDEEHDGWWVWQKIEQLAAEQHLFPCELLRGKLFERRPLQPTLAWLASPLLRRMRIA